MKDACDERTTADTGYGSGGQVGGIGGAVVRILLERQVPVRAFVRRDDERADALRRAGAEIFVGDLTRTEDIARAVDSCRRIYFGMSVSSTYLEATVSMAAVARDKGDIDVLINMSQMTVSRMNIRKMTELVAATAALAGRASLELVRLAGGPCAADGVPGRPVLSALGRRADPPRRHHPAALRFGTYVSGGRPGCRASDRHDPARSRAAHRQDLRADRTGIRRICTPSPPSTARHWGARSPMSTCRSRRGPKNCADATCLSTSSNIC